MKRGLWQISFGAMLFIASCTNPFARYDRVRVAEGFGRVTVSTNPTSPRTVVPDFTTAVDSFEVVLTSHDGYEAKSATVTLPVTSYTFDSVETGTWDITVTAKKAGATVGVGSAAGQTIETGVTLNVVVPVSFSRSSGTGNLSLAISFPADTGIDYVEGAIEGATIVPNLTSNGTALEGTFVQDNIAAGSHDLVMTFKRGGPTGTTAGVFTEAVNIWANLTSDHWIDSSGAPVAVRAFTAQEFLDATASLQNLTLSAGTISFQSLIYGYDAGRTLSPNVTITPTGSVPGQYIQYRVNGDTLVEIRSEATSAPLPLDPGDNTLEVQVTAPDGQTVRTYSVALARTLTVDHTNFDPSTLTDQEIEAASLLKVYFEHASVGGNIFSDPTNGFDTLKSMEPRYSSDRVSWNPYTVDPSWFDTHTGLADLDRGNPGELEKINSFDNSITTAFGTVVDVASFKYCFIDSPDFTATRTMMETLEAQYPAVVFVWWTQPLETSARDNRQQYNDQVRSYCQANAQWLLDIADIESHDDSGVAYTDSSQREILYSGYTPDNGHLNSVGSVKMAKAYWRLIGEIAKTR